MMKVQSANVIIYPSKYIMIHIVDESVNAKYFNPYNLYINGSQHHFYSSSQLTFRQTVIYEDYLFLLIILLITTYYV